MVPNMADMKEIAGAAKQAAIAALGLPLDAQVERGISSEGDEIIRVTLVLPDGAIDEIADDKVIATLLAIKRSVRALGDERLAVISYATEAELADDGSSES